MVIDNNGGTVPNDPAGALREALGGAVVRREREPSLEGPPELRQGEERMTLSDRLAMSLRSATQEIEKVQERIAASQVATDALSDIRDAVDDLRTALTDLGEERISIDLLSQAIQRISELSENATFSNVPLLDDFNAESLGLTRIIPNETPDDEVGRVLREGSARLEERLDEVREEEAVDRRQLQVSQVRLENVQAALNVERVSSPEETEENLRAVREELDRQEPSPGSLDADRVLDLI